MATHGTLGRGNQSSMLHIFFDSALCSFYLGSFLTVSFKKLQSPGYIKGEIHTLSRYIILCVHCFIRASMVAQMVKNLPAVWETCVLSLGWEGPLEEGMATHPNILAYSSPLEQSPWTE